MIGWAFLLLVAALLLIGLEVFVPSGGVISFLAICSLIAAIAIGFLVGPGSGLMILILVTVLGPVVVSSALRWYPHTAIGRMVVSVPPEDPDEMLPEATIRVRALVGRHAVAATTMLPGGIVRIDGEAFDAVSDGKPIERGTTVEVVEVRTNRLIVRAVDSLNAIVQDAGDSLPDHSDGPRIVE